MDVMEENGAKSEVCPKKFLLVVAKIKEMIAGGELTYGDPLPPERRLIDDIGASRSSLREAFDTLETMGFIERIPCKGRFLRTPKKFPGIERSLTLGESSVLEMAHAREMIEPIICAEAARYASSVDIANLRRLLSMNAYADKESPLGCANFHMAVAEATHNFIFINIARTYFSTSSEVCKLALDTESPFAELDPQHEEIYAAIEAHDPDGAERAASRHIAAMKKILIGILSSR